MTSRMVGSVLTLVILLFSVVCAAAQTYTQMQWGMNKGVTPYAFGANINGTWRDLGTVSAAGAWGLSLAGGVTLPTTSAGASGSAQIKLNSRDGASVERTYTIQSDQFGNAVFIPGGSGAGHLFTNPAGNSILTIGSSGQSTFTIPAPSWNTYSSVYPGVAVNTNNFPASSLPPVGSAYSILGMVDIPATTSNPSANLSAGVAGYARTASTLQQAVGVLGSGQIATNNGSAWSMNTLATNAPDFSNTPNNGYTNFNLWGVELDFRIAKKSDGTDPGGNLVGIDLVGNSDAQPLGYARAIWIQPHGLYTTPATPWKEAIRSDPGAAQTFATINETTATGASGSQPVKFISRDGANVERTYTIQTDEFGNGIYTPGSGAGHVFTNDAGGSVFNVTGSGIFAYSGITSAGTKPTITGAGGTCAAGTVTGGALVGTVALTGNCVSTNTLALTGMPAATTGYVCDATDRTAKAVTLVETTTTTTSATFEFTASSNSGNVIQFKCLGY